jgi:hypothetical protein
MAAGGLARLARWATREPELSDLLRQRRSAANDNFEFDPLDAVDAVIMLGEAAPAVFFLFPMWAAASAYLKDPQYYLNKRLPKCGEESPPNKEPVRPRISGMDLSQEE